MNNFFENYDFLITPTMATTSFVVDNPPEEINSKKVHDKLWDFTPFTYYFNLTGNPAATIPVGFDDSNMPIGLQIVGKMGREIDVFKISKEFEQIFKWYEYRADTSI